MITIFKRCITTTRTNPINQLLNHNRRIQNRTIIGATSKRLPIICRMMEEEKSGSGSGLSNGGGSSAGGVRVSNGSGVVAFPLSPASALKIQKGDITRWSVDGSSDAIVNPANEVMLGGGGADGAIHRAAGPELREACYKVPEVRPGVRCPTGEARITPGFRLPAAYVIHTVGPVYDADPNPEASLRSAYRYPFDEAATVAITAVKEFANDIKEVHFVLFSDDIYKVWLNKAGELLQN